MLQSLTGKFLLASESLRDPNFVRSAILIVRHDAEGAFGFILNRPMSISVGQSLADAIDIAADADQPVYFGGPCQGPVFVVHTDENIGGESPMGGVYVTTDREAIEALIESSAKESSAKESSNDSSEDEPSAKGLAADEFPAKGFAGKGSGAKPVKFFGSYSGWSSLQLETELADGSWLVCNATEADVFSDDEHLWERLNGKLNLSKFIDPSRIPDDPSVN